MKKTTLIVFVLMAGMAGFAQNFYNFSVQQENYSDLQNATSINNGQVWDWDYFDDIPMPFTFSFMGHPVDRFLFDDDYFILLAPGADYFESDEGVYFIATSTIFIQDRTYSTNVSSSPISYKVEGTAGHHILKLEVKNAGLEVAQDNGFSEDQFYLSFQVWLYEEDNSIQIRYGANNITDLDMATDGDGLLVGFGDDAQVSLLSGDSDNPDYGEYTEATFPENLVMNSYPADGTVYTFTPAATAGVAHLQTETLQLYPNPASAVLYIKPGTMPVNHYAVYDTTGKLVMERNVSAAGNIPVDVQGLAPGVYFINVNNQHLKFIKG